MKAKRITTFIILGALSTVFVTELFVQGGRISASQVGTASVETEGDHTDSDPNIIQQSRDFKDNNLIENYTTCLEPDSLDDHARKVYRDWYVTLPEKQLEVDLNQYVESVDRIATVYANLNEKQANRDPTNDLKLYHLVKQCAGVPVDKAALDESLSGLRAAIDRDIASPDLMNRIKNMVYATEQDYKYCEGLPAYERFERAADRYLMAALEASDPLATIQFALYPTLEYRGTHRRNAHRRLSVEKLKSVLAEENLPTLPYLISSYLATIAETVEEQQEAYAYLRMFEGLYPFDYLPLGEDCRHTKQVASSLSTTELVVAEEIARTLSQEWANRSQAN